jgi:NAD+ kinase
MIQSKLQPVSRIALVIHPQYQRAEEALRLIDEAAKRHGVAVVRVNGGEALPTDPPCQVVVSVGGDGTLLAAARRAYPADIPVWGINVGHLGFLTTSGLDTIDEGIESLAKGKYWVERRSMIDAEASGPSGKKVQMVALNDVVVHRDITSGQLSLEAELNGRHLANYDGDGLIVATPTGSTAYALAASGPILSPTLAALLLTPICSHSLSARSLVFDDTSVLTIRPRFLSPDAVAIVVADGQGMMRMEGGHDWRNLQQESGYSVVLRRAERTAGLVRFNEVVFSDVLRDKLGWAGVSPLKRTR